MYRGCAPEFVIRIGLRMRRVGGVWYKQKVNLIFELNIYIFGRIATRFSMPLVFQKHMQRWAKYLKIK
jgi:hypothetical protein